MDLFSLSFSLVVCCSRLSSRLVSLKSVLRYLENLSSTPVRCSNPERAMGRMARRSMSAASLASKSTDGRVMGPRGASGAEPRADLMACSCEAMDAMAWRGGGGGDSAAAKP